MSAKIERNSLVVSIASATIALAALGYSFYQGSLQKQHFETSVQPYITIVPTIDGATDQYGYYIYNAGLGRGYIDSIEYYFDGLRVTGENTTPLKMVVKKFGLNEDCFSFGNPRKNDSVSLDKMHKLLTISSLAGNACMDSLSNFHTWFTNGKSRFTAKIWYRSIYGVKFMYDSADNSQHKL